MPLGALLKLANPAKPLYAQAKNKKGSQVNFKAKSSVAFAHGFSWKSHAIIYFLIATLLLSTLLIIVKIVTN